MTARNTGLGTRRAGNALVLALLVVTTVAALGAGFMHITSSLATRQSVGIDSQRAFYIAEAGLAEGFQAVRIGRSGEIGSIVAPARFGDGLVWVTATDTVGEQVRLESTALCGTGRASLALILEPVDQPLGFFADEDLTITSVLLVDGYDSNVAPYSESVVETGPSAEELRVYADWLNDQIGEKEFARIVAGADPAPSSRSNRGLGRLDETMLAELAKWLPALQRGYPAGHSRNGPVPSYAPPGGAANEDGSSAPGSALGVTTGKGGLLASNGDVEFALSDDEPVEIWGDITLGTDGSVHGLDEVTVSGTADPRTTEVELPRVEVPEVALAPAVRHDGLLPLLVPAGTSGHLQIVVGAGAELVLRGPSTVVIGDLVLEPGAALSFDTRAGSVALYVLRSLDLQPGSFVTNSDEAPDQTTVQVAATDDDPLDPAVKLDATAQFHGTLYAPESNVRIGSDFEFFGGVIARRLEIGAGARLHFDHAGVEGSPIPRILSWRVVEIPNEVSTVFADPFRILGVERDALTELSLAHDLGDVQLDVLYVDTGGVTRTWSGTEDQFDWSRVESLESVARTATREKEVGVDDEIKTDPDADEADDAELDDAEADDEGDKRIPGVRSGVLDALAHYLPNRDHMAAIHSLAPYSSEEWRHIQSHVPRVRDDEILRLKVVDFLARLRGGH